MWSFGNDYTRNVLIFDVDNISLSNADNHKNDFFSVLGEANAFCINGSLGGLEEEFRVIRERAL